MWKYLCVSRDTQNCEHVSVASCSSSKASLNEESSATVISVQESTRFCGPNDFDFGSSFASRMAEMNGRNVAQVQVIKYNVPSIFQPWRRSARRLWRQLFFFSFFNFPSQHTLPYTRSKWFEGWICGVTLYDDKLHLITCDYITVQKVSYDSYYLMIILSLSINLSFIKKLLKNLENFCAVSLTVWEFDFLDSFHFHLSWIER